MNVEQVTIDDLSAEILQELRPVVFAMRQHPDRVALFEELPGGSATGGAGRPGDENHGFRHRCRPLKGARYSRSSTMHAYGSMCPGSAPRPCESDRRERGREAPP